MQKRDTLYINGKWIKPSGRNTIDVINASTEEVMASIPDGDENDANAAVAAARIAFNGWSTTPPATRGDFLRKIQEGLKARSEELAKTIAGEVGMPLKLSAMIQVGSPVANFGYYAKLVNTFKWEEVTGNSRVVREAVGVAVCITPWNYPLHQIAAKVAAALAAGCTVRSRAAQRVHPGRSDRSGRLAAWRIQSRHRHRPGHRRSAGAPSGCRYGVVHRIDPRRQAHLRSGIGHGQARGAGTGR
jgi:acyl-CoA reductase-like NAD-dependent aldehyde dehydrogenase